MRENKFRAFDSDMQEMHTVSAIYFEANSSLMGTKPYLIDGHNDLHSLDAIVLMQFTELFDDNNLEIFEGDIVEMAKGRFAVEWNDDACEMQYSDGTRLNADDNYGCWKSVRGNIYENAEILEQKQ